MKRLQTTDFIFLVILYYIWAMVDYYAQMFQIDAGTNPAKTIANLMQYDGYTQIRFSFPQIIDVERKHSMLEIKDIYNEYLQFALLPQQQILRPYSTGDSIIEPLYIAEVFEDETHINIDVIYIDNSVALKVVRKKQQEEMIFNLKKGVL